MEKTDEATVPSAQTGTTTLHEALSHQLQIMRLNRKMVLGYSASGNCPALLDLLQPRKQTEFEAYIHGRGLIDLLIEYPGVIGDAADLVTVLPKLAPRLYSISSSPVAHAGQIHTTVAVVRFTSHNRDRGVCSTLFADRSGISDCIPIYIQPNKKFRLPSDPEAPIIMIGPGTGIAPFRAFLHERRVLGQKGRNWLFFGERSAATDYLYREELEAIQADGHLTRLDTAFSRITSPRSTSRIACGRIPPTFGAGFRRAPECMSVGMLRSWPKTCTQSSATSWKNKVQCPPKLRRNTSVHLKRIFVIIATSIDFTAITRVQIPSGGANKESIRVRSRSSRSIHLRTDGLLMPTASRTGSVKAKACNCGKNDDRDAAMSLEHTPLHCACSRSSVKNAAWKSPRSETLTP
jgi:FAD binding domain-containing protein/flavin-dependent oxidoreductase